MKELLRGIYQWSWLSPEKGIDFNGLYIRTSDEAILIDPPPFGEGDFEKIRWMDAPRAILITNRHHARRAAECREQFGARILVPAADESFFTIPVDGTFADGDVLPCGFKAVTLPHAKSAGETALYHSGRRILVLGDALIGKPPGELSFLPESMFADMAKARLDMLRLLELDFDTVLVGDGASILTGGKAAVRSALERTP